MSECKMNKKNKSTIAGLCEISRINHKNTFFASSILWLYKIAKNEENWIQQSPKSIYVLNVVKYEYEIMQYFRLYENIFRYLWAIKFKLSKILKNTKENK